MLKADPPDFIDSGSYEVTDVRGWGKGAAGLAVGTAIAVAAIGVGVHYGGRANSTLFDAVGVDSANNDSGPSITIN
jgi:hypothetical protein